MAVSCTSGQVRVHFEGMAKDYLLTPGKEVAINASGNVTTREEASPESLDWLSDRSVFVNRPLTEVLRELERQFDLEIRPLGDLDPAKKYNITFPNDDVDAALNNVVTTIKGYTFDRSENVVTLRPTN
jgi:ferric-dicitrate binding protein FerR (iron transport regulator)